MPKYFINSSDINGNEIGLTGDTAHHLLHVLRLQPGERIMLCDGRETDYYSVIIRTFPKENKLLLQVENVAAAQTEPSVRVTLYQALPKGDKMEWIIQKCVELGIYAIVPVLTARSVVRVREGHGKTDRYRRIAEAAAGQCMRGIIPLVNPVVSFNDALLTAGEDMHLLAYENERQVTVKQALYEKTPASIALWIGPEGGFCDHEQAALCARGAVSVTLGRRILRTETAGMAGLVQILCSMEA